VRDTISRIAIASTALLAAGSFGIVAAGPAAASVARSASVAPADTIDGEVDGTATIPGTNTLCAYHYRWHVDTPVIFGGDSEVEWTNNPCGFSIQERSWCANVGVGGSWSTSGVVVRLNLWDKSSCGGATTINRGEVRFDFGNGWTTYKTFWTP